MKIYLVGGAVRDQLLGLPVRERDWLVVGATEAEMLALGYQRLDAEFPVFLHPQSGDEFALARTETKTGPGYKGFEVDAGPQVTLEQDLRRRDLTINALALDQQGQLIDLFGGRQDLDAGVLRHITPAFVEDPVRLLRIGRFAARLGRWGFRVAHGTHRLLRQMATDEDLGALRPERLWKEMVCALGEEQPWRFFEVLHRCGALQRLIPELARELGDSSAYQGLELPAPLLALRRAAALSPEPAVRFAAAFQAAAGTDAAGLCRRVRAEREPAELLELLVRWGAEFRRAATGDAAQLLALLQRLRAWQRPQRWQGFVMAARAVWPKQGQIAARRLQRALLGAQQVQAQTLADAGLQGAELGHELQQRRVAAVEIALASLGSGVDG